MDKNSNVIKIAKGFMLKNMKDCNLKETSDEIKFQMTMKVLISLNVLIHV